MCDSLRARFGLLVAAVLFCPGAVSATTIDPLLFEEMVLRADFVGVAECVQAGGIVAHYKVVESWKGPKVGTRISIRHAVNYWEPQYPIALCGERYFFTAYKTTPSQILTSVGGSGVPLWWRNVPADYDLPLFQGSEFLAPGEDKSPEFDKSRQKAQALLALKPAEQETALLRALIEKYLFGKKWLGGEADEAKAKTLRDRLEKRTSAGPLVDELLQLAKKDPEKWAVRVEIVLSTGGDAVTLERLEALPADRSPWEKSKLDRLVKEIQRRRNPKAPEKRANDAPAVATPPTAAELAKFRKTLSMGMGSEGFGEAFEVLTRHEPGPVVELLLAWENTSKELRDADLGYFVGSLFAWQCGPDRKKHLTALAKAKDPWVRVAGAVYLCYEDVDAGTAALKPLTTLEGGAGVWAALTLARRGDKDAIPRVLEVFRAPSPEQKKLQFGMSGVPHRNLQKRVLVLLSNSAQAGGVPQPVLPDANDKQQDYFTKWWKEHRSKVVLQDPWLKVLEKQKVD